MDDIRLVSLNEQKRPSYDFNKLRINGTNYRNEVILDLKKINEKQAKKNNLRER